MPGIMPNADSVVFKEKFVERYSSLTDWESFKRTSLTFPRKGVRINTLKRSIEEIKGRLEALGWILEQVPWIKEGFWIKHETGRRDLGNTLEHSLGYIYVQEPVSMIPPIVLEPKPHELVLDMCASPGSKTTEIAQMMQNSGILIANDYKGDRIAALGINIQRSGISNIVISLMMGHQFRRLLGKVEFDKILVDAPCSGTGTIRKSLKTLQMWNPNMIRKLSGMQKQLLDTAFNLIKEDGVVVYSTCSCEPEENEEVIDFLLGRYAHAKLEPIELKGLKRSEPILEFEGKNYNPEIKKCLRLWPQDNDTEGFFVAKVRKI